MSVVLADGERDQWPGEDAEAMEPVPNSGYHTLAMCIHCERERAMKPVPPLSPSLSPSLSADLYSDEHKHLLSGQNLQRSGFGATGPKEGCTTYKKEGAK